MRALPVLQHGSEASVCMADCELPVFYMADYSVLGLLVGSLDRASQFLEDKDYTVHKKSDYFEVAIDRADQMSKIVNLLNQNGIDCSIADIVDQLYQG
jgi:hypothetical protein